MKKIIIKTTLALAVAAASTGAIAATGDHVVTAAPTLANEIFGTGSEATLIAVPQNDYTPDDTATVANFVNVMADTEEGTVKITVDKGAHFGEDLSDIQKWADSNATLEFSFNAGGSIVAIGGAGDDVRTNVINAAIAGLEIEVDQGGAIGDNTITFLITNGTGADLELDGVTFGQFRLKNLTSALQRGSADPQVKLGTEWRNVTTADTDTQAAQTILRSQNGIEMTGQISDYSGDADDGWRAMIDVADGEETFTGDQPGNTGEDASQDFDDGDNVAYVALGRVQIVRTTYNGLAADIVKKENGDDFDFQGSDEPVLTITSSTGLSSFAAFRAIPDAAPGVSALDPTRCAATGAAVDSDVPGAGMTSTLSLDGETTNELEEGYYICAYSKGTAAIPEASFDLDLDVTYFNPRYTISEDSLDLEQILRNGCQVTLFNVPNPVSGDKAFIRLTNISDNPGAVKAYMWTEDGVQIDLDSELVSSLAAHATAVLSSDTTHAGYIGDVMTTYGAQTSGRNRIVLQGAFPACEALGLVRTPAGVLTNMTSTVYSGDDNRFGSDSNNTSNTSE
jgi:hypothetical protein